eukprot:COSAG05_NODE_32_length_28165_cov_450.666714_26_plen_75_part_00
MPEGCCSASAHLHFLSLPLCSNPPGQVHVSTLSGEATETHAENSEKSGKRELLWEVLISYMRVCLPASPRGHPG